MNKKLPSDYRVTKKATGWLYVYTKDGKFVGKRFTENQVRELINDHFFTTFS